MAHSMWPLIYLVDLAEILSVLSRPSHQLNRVYKGGDHMIQPDLTEAFIMYVLQFLIQVTYVFSYRLRFQLRGEHRRETYLSTPHHHIWC